MNNKIKYFSTILIIITFFIPKIAMANFEAYVGCHCWLNTGNLSNLWQRQTSWDIPFSGTIYVHSSFCDLDNDGDYDAYVTDDGSNIMAFENIGSDTAPAWQRKIAWDFVPSGMSQIFWADFVDINGDGKCDLCVAKHDTIKFYKNTGSSLFSWTRESDWDIAFPGGQNLSPSYADLDADSDYDIVMENWGPGDLLAFENIGSINVPIWQEKPTWELASPQARPALGDLDGDGDMDMLCTGWAPGSKAYENTGNILNPVWTLRMEWVTTDAYGATYPELIDINDDGAGIEEKTFIDSSSEKFTLEILPNPFVNKTTIRFHNYWTDRHNCKFQVYDIAGKVVKSFSLIPNSQSLITELTWDGTDDCGKKLKAGIYFCRLRTKKEIILPIEKKLIIL